MWRILVVVALPVFVLPLVVPDAAAAQSYGGSRCSWGGPGSYTLSMPSATTSEFVEWS